MNFSSVQQPVNTLTAGYQQPHACSEMVRPVTWSCTVELQCSRLPSSGRGLSINHRVCSKVNICLEVFKNDNAPLNGCVFFIEDSFHNQDIDINNCRTHNQGQWDNSEDLTELDPCAWRGHAAQTLCSYLYEGIRPQG